MSTPENASSDVQSSGNAPKRGKKYFTLDEANRAVPYVSRVVADAGKRFRRVVELKELVEAATGRAERERAETEHDAELDKLMAHVQELQHVGVEVRDIERGLLDFPSVHEGREICLCWLAGESKVDAWHEVDAGFSGRQGVELLKQ